MLWGRPFSSADKVPNLLRILNAASLHTAGNVYPPGLDHGYGIGHVAGGQPSGQQKGVALLGQLGRDLPVEHLARASLQAVHQTVQRNQVAVIPEALDILCQPGYIPRSGTSNVKDFDYFGLDSAAVVQGFLAAKLHQVQLAGPDNLVYLCQG